MIKTIFSIVFFCSAMVFAQKNSSSSQKPLVLFDGMLASQTVLDNKNTKNIASMNVYKDKLPATLKGFESLLKNGVIAVTLKENHYDRLSLADLNEQHQLPKNNPVIFEDKLFTDTSVLIIGDVLVDMQKTTKDGATLLEIFSSPRK